MENETKVTRDNLVDLVLHYRVCYNLLDAHGMEYARGGGDLSIECAIDYLEEIERIEAAIAAELPEQIPCC